MKGLLSNQTLQTVEADAVIVVQFEADGRPQTPSYDAVRASTGGWLEDVETWGEAKGTLYATVSLHRPPGMQAKRLLLAGAGNYAKFSAAILRKLVAAVVRKCKGSGAATLAF